jgi:hypothetical protein
VTSSQSRISIALSIALGSQSSPRPVTNDASTFHWRTAAGCSSAALLQLWQLEEPHADTLLSIIHIRSVCCCMCATCMPQQSAASSTQHINLQQRAACTRQHTVPLPLRYLHITCMGCVSMVAHVVRHKRQACSSRGASHDLTITTQGTMPQTAAGADTHPQMLTDAHRCSHVLTRAVMADSTAPRHEHRSLGGSSRPSRITESTFQAIHGSPYKHAFTALQIFWPY